MLVLARWVHFFSMAMLFGGSFFWLYIGPRGTLAGLPWTSRATTRIFRVAAPVAALSGIAWLVASIANMTGDFAGVVDRDTLHAFFFETPFGSLAVVRLILLASVVALTVLAINTCPRFALLAAISALLLVSQAWLGHAAEGGDTLYGKAMIAAYDAHVIAAAAWLGGLPPLLLAIVEQREYADPGASTLRLLSRYSAMAVAVVSVIVLSGIANTAFRAAGAFGTLMQSVYGKVLLVKLGMVSIMLALAGVNRIIIMPRLSQTSDSPASAGTLEKSIALECICGILVIGAAAILGITPPPR